MSLFDHFWSHKKSVNRGFLGGTWDFYVAVKMPVIGGPKEGVKMAPENGGIGTILVTSRVLKTQSCAGRKSLK